ncbi:MerR family transcriptional regulator [Thiohalorhabdus sp. Cl-TMA]|uniref:Mercuric resistance operon regulatory protein n=1 Tax=Thiohalorhabdus methylotrophus TaxID=3242694 RepID=A0ABV4TSL7_9GAMM
MTIGVLAQKAGVNVETVRYYQRKGLLPEPPRPPGGVRYYGTEVIDRIRFIKRAQYLGFTLREVGELLAFGSGSCKDVEGLAAAKLSEVEARISDLQAIRQELERLLEQCRGGELTTEWDLIRVVIGQETGSDAGEG